MASLVVHHPTSSLPFPNPLSFSVPRPRPLLSLIARAQNDAAIAELSTEAPVASIQEPAAPRKPSPLQKGGTLDGPEAEGKDPSPAALGQSAKSLSSEKFSDPRWRNGTWDLTQFSKKGTVDWDAVIDAEVLRRKWLEEKPETSSNDDPVVFETSSVPWWAWVKRFHLPEAELLNGRAAMVGFFMGYVVDSLTGVGLVDQTNSFFGKLLLFITVVGILFIRKNDDIDNLKQVIKEWNLYDKQWQATWQDGSSSSPDGSSSSPDEE